MLQYKRGDLFTATGANVILAHACNCKGSWGAGIATQFKKNCPIAYKDYQSMCKKHGIRLLGMGVYHKAMNSTEIPVGYLFTSKDYGVNRDSVELILRNTKRSIGCFLSILPQNAHVCSPKINSGLFGVPWKQTEQILIDALKLRPDVTWTVYEL